MQNPQEVQLAAQALQSALPAIFRNAQKPGCAIILGTGLSGLLGELGCEFAKVPFSQIPGMPRAGVASHRGEFAAGLMDGMPVVAQCGRCHIYEGFSPDQVCFGIRMMRALGCGTLMTTSSAGALNPLFEAGSLMLLSDIINHTGLSPLRGENHDPWGERFPDMSLVFSPALQKRAMDCALKLGIRLERGVYIGVHGPEMETPAETRMYRQWGADAIGMSTVLEVIAARHLGMDCVGISCLTNKNLPDCMVPAPMERVVAMAEKCAPDLARLLAMLLASMLAE